MAVDQRPPYSNIPEISPNLAGVGRAWKMATVEPQVALWLVDTEGFGNSQWWWYVVLCNHMRPLSKEEHWSPPRGSGTHELVIGAWQPDVPLPPIYGPGKLKLLAPVDFVQNVNVKTDKQAAWLTERLANDICQGDSPDQENTAYIGGLIEGHCIALAMWGDKVPVARNIEQAPAET